MRWLVTGATGFIGRNLATRLLARGQTVRALVRTWARGSDLAAAGVELALGDVTDPASLPTAIDGCEVVVHVAGLVKALDRRDYFRTNAEGTRHLAEASALARRPPRFLLVSSLAAGGPARGDRPRSEEDAPAPVSAYGESKLHGEDALRWVADRLEATIVRPPIVYGPRDQELLPQLARMARLGIVLKSGFGEKRYSVIHVEDLCDGILAAVERGRRVSATGRDGTYYLSDGAVYTWDQIGLEACQAIGRRARVVALPEAAGLLVAAGAALAANLTRRPAMLSFDKMRELRQRDWTCRIDRARSDLGFEPRFSLAEGMRQSVEWLRAQGMVR